MSVRDVFCLVVGVWSFVLFFSRLEFCEVI